MAGLLGDVLPYLYSRGNALQRRLNGLLDDPLGTAQQAGGLLQDNARQHENLLAQAFQDPRQPFRVTDSNALQQASMNALAGLLGFAPVGMMAYHGSPAVFDKFSAEKIGSGRGLEQGWGVYLTDAERVARENGPNVYKVDVPDDAVARMLQWQEQVGKQPRAVRKGVLSSIGPGAYRATVRGEGTGSDVYNGWLAGLSPQEASELLLRNGIPGLRYQGNGTTNSVLFDPGIGSIVR